MEEYILIFRLDINGKQAQPTNEQMQQYMIQWNKWIDSIIAKDQLAEGGNHLSTDGKVVKKDVISDGVFIEDKLSVAGYILINANNMEEATEIAKSCPILLTQGNSVEVRKIGSTN
ncbi:MAG: YciI family protein [Bacteroidales bacterium]